MIICAKPNPQVSFETSVRICKSIGFRHMRFDINVISKEKKEKYLGIFKKYHELVEKSGLEFAEFHCFAISDIDAFERLMLFYLKLMKLCSAKYLSQHLNADLLNHPDRIRGIIEKFRQEGIYFCIENGLYFPKDASELDSMLKMFPQANFALDIGHCFVKGLDPEELYDIYKDKIKVIHLHDYIESDHEIPFTGKLLERHSFVKKLRDFKDCIVLEIRAYTPDMIEQRYRKSLENTKKFLLE